eukprot:scaffold87178_cov63-Phaeocystis_antarctica.AAC.2
MAWPAASGFRAARRRTWLETLTLILTLTLTPNRNPNPYPYPNPNPNPNQDYSRVMSLPREVATVTFGRKEAAAFAAAGHVEQLIFPPERPRAEACEGLGLGLGLG